MIFKKGIVMSKKWIFLYFAIAGILISPAAQAACTSPPGSDESFEWDETTHTWTYCDGSAWLPFEATGCPTTPTTTGLVAHWKLDEITGTTLADEMGNYNATYQATPMQSGGSNTGNSLIVQDLSHRADASTISEINNASAITITAWMRRWKTNEVLTVGKGMVSNDATGIEIYSDGKVYFEIDGNSNDYGEITLNDAAWHHYAMVFDGTLSGNSNRLKAYVDKTLQSLTFTGTIPATTASTADAFTIGDDAGGYGGYIDEVRVYDRALNATEIGEIYDYNNAGCD